MMEYRGYLKRSAEGRATHIELTKKGAKHQPKLKQAWDGLQNRCTSILGNRYTNVLTEMTFKAARQFKEGA